MTEAEMRGRIVVLEVLCMSALGIIFALTAESDPQHQKSISALDGIKVAAKRRLTEANDPAIVRPGEIYLDELLSELSDGLGFLRPKPKAP